MQMEPFGIPCQTQPEEESHGKKQRDFSATLSGKLKMVIQCVAVTASLLSLDRSLAGATFILVRDILLWSAVAVTVWSGLVYVQRALAMLRVPAE